MVLAESARLGAHLQFDSSGTGRTALWTVAWRITEDHPVAGVGLDNFIEQAPKYTLQPESSSW